MGGRARDGSGGHFCWSLGQQQFLEGGTTVITGSIDKTRGTKAHKQWGCVVQAKGAFPAASLLHKRDPPTRRASKALAPPERVVSILAAEGRGPVVLAEKDRGTVQWRESAWRIDCAQEVPDGVHLSRLASEDPCSVRIWVWLIYSE